MDNWSERSVDTLPVTKYTLLAHFFNFELFIFENEIKFGVCLLLSSEGAPKKLKATTITKLKKLKIGFLTTLSSECIWQHCFFSNSSMDSGRIFRCFHEFFRIVIAYENVIFKAFSFSRIFYFLFFSLGLISGGSRVRKISVILNIKNQIKLKILKKLECIKSILKMYSKIHIPKFQFEIFQIFLTKV